MASSPEFIRLATSSSRPLADTALDSLRDPVVIVDARHRHFLVVLANAAARRCLIEESDTFGLIESPLCHWMAPESAAVVESSLTDPSFALGELASRSRDLYGLDVSFTGEVAQQLNLDETDASHLHRIAQEVRTNPSRHGHATLVHIHLEATGARFLLCIKDNGEGFHPPTSHLQWYGFENHEVLCRHYLSEV